MISDKIQKTWQQITGQTIMEMIAKKILKYDIQIYFKIEKKKQNIEDKCRL